MKFKSLLPYIFFSAAIFLLSLLLGYQAALQNPDVLQEVFRQLKDKFEPLRDAPSYEVFAYIFLNNTLIDLAMILGFFLFGLAPVLVLLGNGLIIGVVLVFAAKEQSQAELLILLAPHGILEIPAFLLAAGTGIWLAVKFFKKIFAKEPLRENLLYALRIFLYIILPLNLIAAFIETYITPLIYSLNF